MLVERHALRPSGDAALAESPDTRGLPLREVRVRALTHRFAGGAGISDVDLVLAGGTFTVMTGPVGAGKTTLLRVLLGLLRPQSGEIWWNGELVERPDLWMVPPRSAFTAQVPRLFTASLEENVLLGLPGGRALALAAVRAAALEPDLAQLESGLDTPPQLRLRIDVESAGEVVEDQQRRLADEQSSPLRHAAPARPKAAFRAGPPTVHARHQGAHGEELHRHPQRGTSRRRRRILLVRGGVVGEDDILLEEVQGDLQLH